VSEVVVVGDVFETIRRFFAKIVQWLAADDEQAKDQDTEGEDDNKSPPEAETQVPKDLGVNVSDKSKSRESFGP